MPVYKIGIHIQSYNKMKSLYFIVALVFFAACNRIRTEKCLLSDCPIEHCKVQKHLIDTVLVYPQAINVFKDKLLVFEPRNGNAVLSVFSCKDFEYLFSGIGKGHAKSEVVYMYDNYYACTDTSFFILDMNVEKEYLLKNNKVVYVGSTPLIIPDALNQLIRVDDVPYITAGFTNGKGGEHLLYHDGEYTDFGEYPDLSLKNEERAIYNGSISAGMVGKQKFWDFYTYQDLIRSYDLQGNLLLEIVLDDDEKNVTMQNVDDRNLNYYKAKWNSKYIAVLYNAFFSADEFYKLSKDERKRELQLWTWDGELKRRIYFDVPYDIYALSEDNIFYAMNMDKPDVIYTYDLNEK